MATSVALQESPDFSLVLGGPTFQLFRRSRLSGDALELLDRRIVVIVLVAWVPLLLLSLLEGHLRSGTSSLPFLRDIEGHVRLLVTLPVLIAAELIVHKRLRPTVKNFLARRIVLQQDEAKFFAAIDSAMRLHCASIRDQSSTYCSPATVVVQSAAYNWPREAGSAADCRIGAGGSACESNTPSPVKDDRRF